MTLAGLTGAVRWLFWCLCYLLAVSVTILALFPRPVPSWAKWAGLAGVVGLLVMDARQKVRARERVRP